MFDKKNSDDNGTEIDKIKDRLDDGESVIMHVRQSRIKPGGAAGINPNTIFVTEKRVIIRNPTRLGQGENIEEYFYHQITNIRLEKGLFSASLIFAIPGMTEISKIDRSMSFGVEMPKEQLMQFLKTWQKKCMIIFVKKYQR